MVMAARLWRSESKWSFGLLAFGLLLQLQLSAMRARMPDKSPPEWFLEEVRDMDARLRELERAPH